MTQEALLDLPEVDIEPGVADLDHHEHHDHDHSHGIEDLERPHQAEHTIDLKSAHACGPDCPEHGHGHHHEHEDHHAHEHPAHHHHDHNKPDGGGVERQGHKHHIELKPKEHVCGADCPEHGHSHHHDEHEPAEHKQEQHRHKIEVKSHDHACGPDCPEHGHGHHHDHQPEKQTERHQHHGHGEQARSRQNENEHFSADTATQTVERDHGLLSKIELKEHACGADCPEHGHSHHHQERPDYQEQQTHQQAERNEQNIPFQEHKVIDRQERFITETLTTQEEKEQKVAIPTNTAAVERPELVLPSNEKPLALAKILDSKPVKAAAAVTSKLVDKLEHSITSDSVTLKQKSQTVVSFIKAKITGVETEPKRATETETEKPLQESLSDGVFDDGLELPLENQAPVDNLELASEAVASPVNLEVPLEGLMTIDTHETPDLFVPLVASETQVHEEPEHEGFELKQDIELSTAQQYPESVIEPGDEAVFIHELEALENTVDELAQISEIFTADNTSSEHGQEIDTDQSLNFQVIEFLADLQDMIEVGAEPEQVIARIDELLEIIDRLEAEVEAKREVTPTVKAELARIKQNLAQIKNNIDNIDVLKRSKYMPADNKRQQKLTKAFAEIIGRMAVRLSRWSTNAAAA